MITEIDYINAAQALKVEVAAIKAVAEVESRGSGFSNGEPTILFERHLFHRFTKGEFSTSYPHISNTQAGGYGKLKEQHQRLAQAIQLDREAALKATSWGRFQIMGFNYRAAGFTELQAFVNAMYRDEREHLRAFVNFMKHEGLHAFLREKNWKDFARYYNGPDYAKNQYDLKLEKAYEKYKGEQ